MIYDPVYEIIFDMTWDFAHWHNKLPDNTKDTLMDYVEGSRGMMDIIVEEAKKFQAYWETLAEDSWEGSNYYELVEKALETRLAQLVVEAGLQV